MPILDIKVWIEEKEGRRIIMYEYYRKTVSSNMMIHANSAIAACTKRTIFTQEALRILLNCSRELPWSTTTTHIIDMMKRMQFSGYKKEFRHQVIKSALTAYKNITEAEERGERPMHRPKRWNQRERYTKKAEKRKNWLNPAKYESVIFVPATPKSKLQLEMQKRIKRANLRIKVVEKTGTTLKQKLQKSDPFKEKYCKRSDCLVCTTGGKGRCDRASIKYSIKCMGNDGECNGIYHGETSENAYTRGKEHLHDINRGNSRILTHFEKFHGNIPQPIRMNVDKTYQNDAMKRQITEGIYIDLTAEEAQINERSEWNNRKVGRTSKR